VTHNKSQNKVIIIYIDQDLRGLYTVLARYPLSFLPLAQNQEKKSCPSKKERRLERI
jgi:hypothetical protein